MRLMVGVLNLSKTFLKALLTWIGLLNHDWSDYRGVNSANAIKDVIRATYAAYGQ